MQKEYPENLRTIVFNIDAKDSEALLRMMSSERDASKPKTLFTAPGNSIQLESGFLRSRAVMDLSSVVASSVFEWAKSNGVQCLKSEDIGTVMQVLRLLAERQNGGK